MTVPTYRRLSLAVRPVRLAFLVPSTASPEDLTQILARFTECWGGAYFLPIPVRDGKTIDPVFWRILRAYDPDRVAADPRPKDDLLRRVFNECCLQEYDDVKTWLNTFDGRSRHPDWHAVSMSRYFGEREKLERSAGRQVDPAVSRLGDPAADLALAAGYGAMSEKYTEVVERCGFPKVTEIALGNFREALRSTWSAPAPLASDPHEAASPFSVTLWGCRWYWRIQAKRPPFVVVIGDTAEDFCLYYSLNRLLGGAAWLPESVLRGGTDLSKVWIGSVTAEVAVRLPHSQRPSVLITSVSHESEKSCRKQLERFGDEWAKVPFRGPDDIPLEAIQWLWDQHEVEVSRYEPFVLGRAVAPLPPLRPTLLASLPLRMGEIPNVLRPDWFVDVDVEAWQAPVRGCLRGLVSIDSEWGLRVSREGISYNSQAQGLERNVREDALIAQPRVAVPAAEEMFARLAQTAGVAIKRSAVGAFAAGSASLWGSVESFAWALREGKSLALLEGYVRDPPAEDERLAGRWLSLSRRWFLTLDDMSSLVGEHDHARDMA